jgi:hypothetical protein
VLIPSHRKLLRSKAVVVSVADTPGQARAARGCRRPSRKRTNQDGKHLPKANSSRDDPFSRTARVTRQRKIERATAR